MNIQLKDVVNVVFNGIDVSAVKFNDVLVWRKWETIEYTGAVPVEIYAAGEPLIDYLISGNMQQTGTPSPQSIIMPQECGERTGNLFDINTTPVSLYYQTQREVITTSSGVVSIIMPVSPNTTYTFNNPAGNRNRICETENVPKVDDTVINYIASDGNVSITLTTSNNTHYILWWVGYQQTYSNIADALSINLGSTPLPYEPYGYKIPISSGNTTTPIYLGEVETTRQIRKLVLTGEETGWTKYTTFDNYYQLNVGAENAPRYGAYDGIVYGICTHYVGISGFNNNNVLYGMFCADANRIRFRDVTINTLEDFKAYLAAQYANGTPVTIWYTLANPTTGILNEPLRKIGDYADTISAEQAGVSIPTVEGANVVDVETTLKPSEVYIKYKGKST